MIDFLTEPEEWDRVAEESFFPHIGYKYGWLQAVGASFPDLKPLPFAIKDDSGEVQTVCPCFHDTQKRELISSPFLVPGFINKNVSPLEVVHALFDYAKRERCRRISLQVPPGFYYTESLLAAGFRLTKKICFFNIEVRKGESFDDFLAKRVTRKKRQDINQARRKGVTVGVFPPSEEVLDRFYPFYQEFGQRRNIKIFDKSFIRELSRSLEQNMRFWIASLDNRDIGSAINFEFKQRLWGWLLQGGHEYKCFKTDSVLYAETIRYGIEHGMSIIDIGTSPLESTLADFKLRLGATPVFHEYYTCDLSTSNLIRSSLKKGNRLVKKLGFRNR